MPQHNDLEHLLSLAGFMKYNESQSLPNNPSLQRPLSNEPLQHSSTSSRGPFLVNNALPEPVAERRLLLWGELPEELAIENTSKCITTITEIPNITTLKRTIKDNWLLRENNPYLVQEQAKIGKIQIYIKESIAGPSLTVDFLVSLQSGISNSRRMASENLAFSFPPFQRNALI
ncbi:hypothetical protein CEXT_571311 [Caerostris extrusa]|uniref:Uncharacterized protein n=1 Tax=Caerostris extrusa TaxID=172846 RepID=A0AAV4N5Z6_CAEEX|nr:hypothetical protein CEXT_571311 [Caerostris extrusa]